MSFQGGNPKFFVSVKFSSMHACITPRYIFIPNIFQRGGCKDFNWNIPLFLQDCLADNNKPIAITYKLPGLNPQRCDSTYLFRNLTESLCILFWFCTPFGKHTLFRLTDFFLGFVCWFVCFCRCCWCCFLFVCFILFVKGRKRTYISVKIPEEGGWKRFFQFGNIHGVELRSARVNRHWDGTL